MVFSFDLTYQEKKSILQDFTQLCRPKNFMGMQKMIIWKLLKEVLTIFEQLVQGAISITNQNMLWTFIDQM